MRALVCIDGLSVVFAVRDAFTDGSDIVLFQNDGTSICVSFGLEASHAIYRLFKDGFYDFSFLPARVLSYG